jgi:hypothetical protein
MSELPAPGDRYADLDYRQRVGGGRVVKIVKAVGPEYARQFLIENVEHWDARLVGRRTYVTQDTLATRYERLSH